LAMNRRIAFSVVSIRVNSGCPPAGGSEGVRLTVWAGLMVKCNGDSVGVNR
jgi:hypothetical protein